SVGAVRVAGKILKEPAFPVEVPGEYALVAEGGAFSGYLDGRPYQGPRYLEAGMHEIAAPAGSYALLWSRAAERGLTPFAVPQKRWRKLSPRRHVGTFQKGAACAKHR